MPAGTQSGWMWGVEKIDIDASQRNQTDSCIGFACFSATSAICFKMRLYCPSLSSLRFNFCGELRGRKTICDLPSCKPASQPPAAAGSVLRAVKHFRDTECSWNAARQAEPGPRCQSRSISHSSWLQAIWALTAAALCQLVALLAAGYWKGWMPLATALLPRNVLVLVVLFCYSSLTLHHLFL